MNALPTFWYHYYVVLILSGWLGSLIFPVVYAITMRFWESELGMHFFAYGVVVWLNLTPAAIFVTLGDFPGRAIINFIIFHITVVVIWWRAIIFSKILVKSRRPKGDFTPTSRIREQDME